MNNQINNNKKPVLMVSDKISTPLLMGLLNPVIVLPEKIKKQYNNHEIKAIIAH